MSSQNSSALFFAGLVTGGVLGAGMALLMAPQSGLETRRQIRNKGIELTDGAVEGLTEVGQRARGQAAAWQEKG
jgi:gas vesicle protein